MEYKNGRRNSRVIKVGHIPVGGTNPIPIQSMTNTDPHDIKATLAQARALEAAGCDILRLTVPDARAAEAIAALKAEGIRMPLVADIHFDYRLALAAIAAGVDKVRINPGNIGDKARVRAVVDACREREIPIRIGVNSGSLEKHILENTAHRQQRLWQKARFITRRFWRSFRIEISRSPSRRPRCRP